jgi:hypothetical protein
LTCASRMRRGSASLSRVSLGARIKSGRDGRRESRLFVCAWRCRQVASLTPSSSCVMRGLDPRIQCEAGLGKPPLGRRDQVLRR